MIAAPPGIRILVARQPVDFRRGLHSLAALVQERLRAAPFAGDIFVFRARRADRIKLLVWDGTGLCLYQKHLEKGRFVWPAIEDGTLRLTPAQLSMLLEGLDWTSVRINQPRRPVAAC